MAVRKLNPVTPGQRHKIIGVFDTITANAPEKSLVFGFRKSGGRNNTGKMTMRYIGGGHKRKFRVIDFKRDKDGVPAIVKTIDNHKQWYTSNKRKQRMLSWVIRMQTVIRFTATDATALPHVESFELDGNIIAGEQGLHPLL